MHHSILISFCFAVWMVDFAHGASLKGRRSTSSSEGDVCVRTTCRYRYCINLWLSIDPVAVDPFSLSDSSTVSQFVWRTIDNWSPSRDGNGINRGSHTVKPPISHPSNKPPSNYSPLEVGWKNKPPWGLLEVLQMYVCTNVHVLCSITIRYHYFCNRLILPSDRPAFTREWI